MLVFVFVDINRVSILEVVSFVVIRKNRLVSAIHVYVLFEENIYFIISL